VLENKGRGGGLGLGRSNLRGRGSIAHKRSPKKWRTKPMELLTPGTAKKKKDKKGKGEGA